MLLYVNALETSVTMVIKKGKPATIEKTKFIGQQVPALLHPVFSKKKGAILSWLSDKIETLVISITKLT